MVHLSLRSNNFPIWSLYLNQFLKSKSYLLPFYLLWRRKKSTRTTLPWNNNSIGEIQNSYTGAGDRYWILWRQRSLPLSKVDRVLFSYNNIYVLFLIVSEKTFSLFYVGLEWSLSSTRNEENSLYTSENKENDYISNKEVIHMYDSEMIPPSRTYMSPSFL